MGLYGKAEPLYQRAIALLEQVDPPETRGLAFAIGGLADCYVSQKNYVAAEPCTVAASRCSRARRRRTCASSAR